MLCEFERGRQVGGVDDDLAFQLHKVAEMLT